MWHKKGLKKQKSCYVILKMITTSKTSRCIYLKYSSYLENFLRLRPTSYMKVGKLLAKTEMNKKPTKHRFVILKILFKLFKRNVLENLWRRKKWKKKRLRQSSVHGNSSGSICASASQVHNVLSIFIQFFDKLWGFKTFLLGAPYLFL